MTNKQKERIFELEQLLGVEIISQGLCGQNYQYEISQHEASDEAGELHHKQAIIDYPEEYAELIDFCECGPDGYLNNL